MLSHLKGKIIFSREKFVILEVNGVGYKIFIIPEILKAIKNQNTVSLWTHFSVRETSQELYGFLEYSELEFFELLIKISGVGPKSALGVLAVAPLDIIKRAISTNDVSYLTKVSGIGKRIAEKIVLELKDKLGQLEESGERNPLLKEDSDVLEALQSLGYSLREARSALKEIPEGVTGANERIKEALKIMGGQK